MRQLRESAQTSHHVAVEVISIDPKDEVREDGGRLCNVRGVNTSDTQILSSNQEVEDEGDRYCVNKLQAYPYTALSCSRTSYLVKKSKARTHSTYVDNVQVPLDANVDSTCLALSYQCR